MSWRYVAAKLTGDGQPETWLDLDVPLLDVECEDMLTGVNSLTANISPEYSRLKTDDGKPLFEEWGTAIFAEDSSGEIRGGGILVNSALNGPDWGLECVGYTGYLTDLAYTGPGEHFEEVDAADIFRAVWDYAQSEPGGDLRLEVDGYMSRVLVGDKLKQIEFDTENGPVTFEAGPYKLNRFSNHDLSDDVTELASIGRFDWRERHYWRDDATMAHVLDLGTIGRRRDDLRFMVGENVQVIPEVERDGELYADTVLALGAGEGSAQKSAVAWRKTGRLRRTAVVIDSSLRSQAAVARRAEAEVAWRNDIDAINTLIVTDHPHADPSSVQAGDEIRIQGDLGWTNIDTWARVLSRKISPSDADSVELSVVRTSRLTS